MKFKTNRAVKRHMENKHFEEADSSNAVRFFDNDNRVVSEPTVKSMNRRSKEFKGYLEWLAGLTEQINASLHPRLKGNQCLGCCNDCSTNISSQRFKIKR